ncbi:MFS transporter [Actinopolymorpha singaporensis]|uniref:MFS transporter, DHA2 family, methylenomycin A resistance protein n=1 Tax=Actinopolymorpha singaporensis TaxID=117157 RepID=A0A1H1WUB7_9ACTN|nr:MFS transporter [Actinopolymorpha singaporensis]SDS99759.1 MFS transporter, DHA2 family, methylenomycin A resistance protein [Actinopolymorpha singaporensis]
MAKSTRDRTPDIDRSAGRSAPTGGGLRRSAPARPGLVLATMCVGMFLVLLDVTVVNVALPTLGAQLHSDVAGMQWVVDSYTVALAALLLTAGTLGDLRGHSRMVLVGLALFGAASAAAGLAPSLGFLVGARAVQGVGAAILLPCTMAVISDTFPDQRARARALGIWAGVSSLALPAGPVLGGLLVTAAGWRAVFLVNVPVVVAAMVACTRLVPPSGHPRAGGRGRADHQVDRTGALACTVALATAVFAVIEWGRGAGVPVAGAALGVAACALTAFGYAERRAARPLLPPALMRSHAFVGANLVAAAMNFAGIGTIFVATLYLQEVRGHSPLRAGLELLPLFVPLAALSPLTGRLTARFGPRPPMVAGLCVGAAGLVALLLPTARSSYAVFLPALLGLGVGMGLLTAAVVTAAMNAVSRDRAGLAGGVNNTARQSAGALGVAVFGAVTGSPAHVRAFLAGVHVLGPAAACVWLAAAVLTVATVPAQPSS